MMAQHVEMAEANICAQTGLMYDGGGRAGSGLMEPTG